MNKYDDDGGIERSRGLSVTRITESWLTAAGGVACALLGWKAWTLRHGRSQHLHDSRGERKQVQSREPGGLQKVRVPEEAAELARLRAVHAETGRHLAQLDHDLRTPIGTVASALELMRAAPDDVALRAEACRVIARQVARLNGLTQTLHEISKHLDRGAEQVAAGFAAHSIGGIAALNGDLADAANAMQRPVTPARQQQGI